MTSQIDKANLSLLRAQNFIEASKTKDAALMNNIIGGDFLFATPRGTLFYRDDFFSDFVNNTRIKIDLFEIIEHRLIEFSGGVLLNGVIKIRFSGQPLQFERVTFVMIEAEGDLKILSIQGTLTNDFREPVVE